MKAAIIAISIKSVGSSDTLLHIMPGFYHAVFGLHDNLNVESLHIITNVLSNEIILHENFLQREHMVNVVKNILL